MHPQFYFSTVGASYSCGVTIAGSFVHLDPEEYSEGTVRAYRERSFEKLDTKGTGYILAAYVDSDLCREAEEVLKPRYLEVFRSEKRQNKNSYNDFVFVIYDSTRSPDGSARDVPSRKANKE